MQEIADAAIEHFGGFDTWVNNAGLGIVGRIEDGNEEDFRRLWDTNFWGVVNGSLVALPHLKAHGGALINLGSVASDMAIPMQAMYSTTKHAIKGFTDGLRIELQAENAPVSVTLIKPAAINTDFAHHARNYTDREPALPPPIYAPKEVAHGILHAAAHPKRDVYIGGAGRLMSIVNRVAPAVMDSLSKTLIPQSFRDEPPRHPEGALHQAGIRRGGGQRPPGHGPADEFLHAGVAAPVVRDRGGGAGGRGDFHARGWQASREEAVVLSGCERGFAVSRCGLWVVGCEGTRCAHAAPLVQPHPQPTTATTEVCVLHSLAGRSQRNLRSASVIGTSLMLASRVRIRPLSANSHCSLP